MDTLSGSVSALKVHGRNSTSRELYHFKTTSSTSILPYSASKSNLISNKTTSFSPKTFTPIFLSPSPTLSFTSSSSSSSPTLHQKPASGYAAALLGIAQSNGSIDPVEKDVQRLLKLLRNKQVQAVLTDPLVGEKQKGLVMIDEVANYKGMFHKHLVSLVKMLVRKNKASLIEEVLEEFERIYDELSGTKVVLVSSAKKMKEDQLSKIAMSVQSLTGAVKVKVRNLVHENSLSYAV
ncbi:ATP synthase delta chain, chloroplastic [Ziziphus jujuba]|uniref:ATP synthase delta chain, chloroplastic n=2 Tax=Ziziphus jujuba TaxID=326968 RepID=A0A6P3Z6Y3_ZIZJJ|nr:ATP synthase delta chain, chloroplastic [Ziziphus jujuba]KAH7519447.1 hypothetical protein FEM48_Zijuj08G0037100 [Ziziphus jujuba var. spinosa]